MSTRARYDEVVGFYEAENPDDYSAPVDQAFLAMVGQVAGLRVLDVACGAGRISRELARRGAEVVGVDISAGLVARARSAEEAEPLGVLYRIGDIASPDSFAGERFDLATCHFGLSDIDDLDGAVA